MTLAPGRSIHPFARLAPAAGDRGVPTIDDGRWGPCRRCVGRHRLQLVCCHFCQASGHHNLLPQSQAAPSLAATLPGTGHQAPPQSLTVHADEHVSLACRRHARLQIGQLNL